MSRKRLWLEGEIRHVVGATKIQNFLEGIARSMVSQDWINYEKNPNDIAWTFSLRREIKLPTIFKSNNIRLFKATLSEDGEYIKGTVLEQEVDYLVINDILRGIGDSSKGLSGIGDKVLIEVNYEAEEFQRTTFLEERLPSGEVEVVAKLKSRPQGDLILFEDTIVKVTDEELHQMGDNEIFEFARNPISDTDNPQYKLKVVVDGVEKKVNEDFTMDYFNGVIIFNEPLEDPKVVRATYGYRTGKRKEVIPKSKYKVFNDRIIDTSGKTLKNLDVVVEVDYFWNLHYPSKVEDIKDGDRIVLQTTVDISSARDLSKTKKYYWEIKKYDSDSENINYLTGVHSRIGEVLSSEDDTTLDDKLSSDWTKWSWYKGIIGHDKGLILQDELDVKFWMSFTREHINIVIQGNPTPDVDGYSNYLVGHMYQGMIAPYKGEVIEDYVNNYAYCASSDVHPMAEDEYSTKWGQNTGTGITDILMVKTLSNVPFQAHYPAFHTTPEFMKKNFIGKSEATGEHHLSEITVVHPFERERGKLQNVLIGDRSALFHLDELISDENKFDYRGALVNDEGNFRDKCGKAVVSKEKHWITFNINSPYWIGNNSPNVHYGLAIRTK